MPPSDLADVTRAIQRAIRRAGCVVTETRWQVGGVSCDCPDVASKVDLLNEIALIGATDPVIASAALRFRRGWRDDALFAAGVLAWVQTHVRWIDEPGERFQLPRLTFDSGIGDCDCSAVLFVAFCLATGLRARVVGLADQKTGRGRHAVSQVDGRAIGRQEEWTWAETSVSGAPLGRDPREIMRDPTARAAGAA